MTVPTLASTGNLLNALTQTKARIDQALPRWQDPLADTATTTAGHVSVAEASPLRVKVCPELRGIFTDLDAGVAAMTTAEIGVSTAWGDQRFTVEARQQSATAALGDGQAASDAAFASAERRAAALPSQLAALVLPPRPAPADAAQEGALSNLRADLRMLFDGERVEGLLLAKAILAELARRKTAGDDLAVWLLAGSGWTDTYLRSRRDEVARIAFERGVTAVLIPIDTGGDQATARRLLDVFSGPKGITGAITQIRAWAALRLDELTRFRTAN
jgi:hypothetical protein